MTKARSSFFARRLMRAVTMGALVLIAYSGPASGNDNALESCKSTLQQCGNMLSQVQAQRDSLLAANAQCETSLQTVREELKLVKLALAAKKGEGLTHRQALDMMDLSMRYLEKAPEADSPAELLAATRRLRKVQEKATAISQRLTEQATSANAVSLPP
jgi:hypothetical protein